MDAYLVVTDGAGEYESDYSVVIVQAETPQGAAERVTDQRVGYGKTIAYVAPLDYTHIFTLGKKEVSVVEPTALEDVIRELGPNRHWLDPDGVYL